MGKRSAGLAVMIVTLFAVVVINIRVDAGRGVTGSPAVGTVPLPVVGQCLLEQPGRFGGWGFGEPLYPALRLASCSGYRWGEVVAVLRGALATPTSINTTDATGAPVTEIPNQNRCDREKLAFLGGRAGRPCSGAGISWWEPSRRWDRRVCSGSPVSPGLLA